MKYTNKSLNQTVKYERGFFNNHIQRIPDDDWQFDIQLQISPLIGGRSDAIRLGKVPLIIPLESYNLHFPLNYEIILKIFTNYFTE